MVNYRIILARQKLWQSRGQRIVDHARPDMAKRRQVQGGPSYRLDPSEERRGCSFQTAVATLAAESGILAHKPTCQRASDALRRTSTTLCDPDAKEAAQSVLSPDVPDSIARLPRPGDLAQVARQEETTPGSWRASRPTRGARSEFTRRRKSGCVAFRHISPLVDVLDRESKGCVAGCVTDSVPITNPGQVRRPWM